jgi:RNA polymerase sigma-70 factor (ECF subfamily)
MADSKARRAAEQAARTAYGRLIAYLAARTRDVSAAEDALAEAFARALERWPVDGVPERPEAWLLTAARRHLIDGARRQRTGAAAAPTLALLMQNASPPSVDASTLPDRRLDLFFVCAHPAINPTVRTPLMLQTVLGMDAARIASAFLVNPAAMGQRLSRAKRKIRDSGIAFAVPEEDDLPARLTHVLGAIYGAFGTGSDDPLGEDSRIRGLADEAIWLARVLVDQLPNQPEARGLLALMLFCAARTQARRSADGHYIALDEQDTRLWRIDLADEAQAHFNRATAARRIGRFQIEAAIQAVHTQGRLAGDFRWETVARLYDDLMAIAPSLGAAVGRSAARAEAFGAADGLACLDALDQAAIASYQPYWATRAHLLAQLGQAPAAALAYRRAIGLASDPAVRAFLQGRRAAVLVEGQPCGA